MDDFWPEVTLKAAVGNTVAGDDRQEFPEILDAWPERIGEAWPNATDRDNNGLDVIIRYFVPAMTHAPVLGPSSMCRGSPRYFGYEDCVRI